MASATPEPHALDHSNLISTLHFSQKAPVILGGKSGSDNPETYDTLEQLFLSCLQTGDDQSALRCLDQLTHRFGASNERIQGLRGLYQEAIAGKQSDLEDCLRKYDEALAENPMNLVGLGQFLFDHIANAAIAYPQAPDFAFTFFV
jgi:hypothetical protein